MTAENASTDDAVAGMLAVVGGHDDPEHERHVLQRILEAPRDVPKNVEVIPTASEVPDETAEKYLRAFGDLGAANVNVMDVRTRRHAQDPDFVRRVRESDLVFFTGGDQLRITTLIGGTPLHRAIRARYRTGGVIAGTSAGAAAMSGTMIFEGRPEGAMRKGNVQMRPGLDLIQTCVIDTHLIHRGRLSRLLEVVASNPGFIGLGLGEDTGVVIRDGRHLEVIGAGVVVVMDGHGVRHSNITDVPMGQPIAVEGVVVHTLTEGYGYDLEEQRFRTPDGEVGE